VNGHIQPPRLQIEHLSAAAGVYRLAEQRALLGKAVLVPG
jgi:hypothetical protein